jgi:ribonuclease D
LKSLVQELLGIVLDKEQQSSDWCADPLTESQCVYAASDVIHLITLRAQLMEMLTRENRLELARATMACLPARVALDLAGWEEEDIFSHA